MSSSTHAYEIFIQIEIFIYIRIPRKRESFKSTDEAHSKYYLINRRVIYRYNELAFNEAVINVYRAYFIAIPY